MELVMSVRMVKLLDKNQYLIPPQYGFRTQLSGVDAILDPLTYITNAF